MFWLYSCPRCRPHRRWHSTRSNPPCSNTTACSQTTEAVSVSSRSARPASTAWRSCNSPASETTPIRDGFVRYSDWIIKNLASTGSSILAAGNAWTIETAGPPTGHRSNSGRATSPAPRCSGNWRASDPARDCHSIRPGRSSLMCAAEDASTFAEGRPRQVRAYRSTTARVQARSRTVMPTWRKCSSGRARRSDPNRRRTAGDAEAGHRSVCHVRQWGAYEPPHSRETTMNAVIPRRQVDVPTSTASAGRCGGQPLTQKVVHLLRSTTRFDCNGRWDVPRLA